MELKNYCVTSINKIENRGFLDVNSYYAQKTTFYIQLIRETPTFSLLDTSTRAFQEDLEDISKVIHLLFPLLLENVLENLSLDVNNALTKDMMNFVISGLVVLIYLIFLYKVSDSEKV